MVITVTRSESYQTNHIVGAGVASVDIVEQPAEKKKETEYWLLVSGIYQRQWFVARRPKDKIPELEKMRESIADGLKTNKDVTVDGDNLPSFS